MLVKIINSDGSDQTVDCTFSTHLSLDLAGIVNLRKFTVHVKNLICTTGVAF